jgi:hypothetical protein
LVDLENRADYVGLLGQMLEGDTNFEVAA